MSLFSSLFGSGGSGSPSGGGDAPDSPPEGASHSWQELSKEDRVLRVLKGDLMPLEDIHACMVARKNLEGIVPLTEEFKKEILPIWDILKGTMNELFDVVAQYSDAGLDKVYFELGKFDVLFFILPGSDTALVAIVPALANRGLLEVELENARREIIKILES